MIEACLVCEQSLGSSMLGPCGSCDSLPQNLIEKHMCKVDILVLQILEERKIACQM